MAKLALFDRTKCASTERVKAHHKLDATVDVAYAKKKFSGDSDRVAFLFELYQQLTWRLN